MKTLTSLTLIITLCLSTARASDTPDYAAMETMIADGQAKQLARSLEQRIDDAQQPAALDYYWLARTELARIDEVAVFRKPFMATSARDNLETAVALDPDLALAREALARYYLEAPAIAGGSMEGAKQQAERLVELNPPAGYRVNGAIAASEENYAAAVDWYRKALAVQDSSDWTWASQYDVVVRAVNWQTDNAPATLTDARANVLVHASEPATLLPLIDYQNGKYAATSGKDLEAGRDALQRYLQTTPGEEDPGLEWAQFRLAQIERWLGLNEEAQARLAELEAQEYSEDLAFALKDERRWHYAD